MHYPSVQKARFLSRSNRFVAYVEWKGTTLLCHVKNTGRCKELLLPGAAVYLCESRNPARKTRFDLIAVEKNGVLFNIDSQAPNQVAWEWLWDGGLGFFPSLVRPEQKFGASRLDFYYEAPERKGFLEVKGVTLEQDEMLYFPDAPTERGVKHLEELMKCKAAGYEAGVLFVIQTTKAKAFAPNWETHPAFGYALQRAYKAGVRVLARCCEVAPDRMTLCQKAVPVLLEGPGNREKRSEILCQ